MHRRRKSSRLRQRLLEAKKRHSSAVEVLAAERGPLVRGTFQLHGTRCGKPNCRCTRGELHPTAVLTVTGQGKRRNIYVRPPDRPEIQRRSERYRRFRQARAEVVKLDAEILTLADQLQETLVEPYRPKPRKSTALRKQAGRQRNAPMKKGKR